MEVRWMLHKDFPDLHSKICQEKTSNVIEKLLKLKIEVQKWKAKTFDGWKKKADEVRQHIACIQQICTLSDEDINKEKDLQVELNEHLQVEELHWKQR